MVEPSLKARVARPLVRVGRPVVRSARVGLLAGAQRVSSRRLDPGDAVIVLGGPRSGTTWVLELLGSAPGACPVFEPFHPRGQWHADFLAARNGVPAHIPVGGDEIDSRRMESLLRRALVGGCVPPASVPLTTPWALVRAERVVVKSIRLNDLADWVRRRFPRNPIVVVVRNPVAVVESMMRLESAGWHRRYRALTDEERRLTLRSGEEVFVDQPWKFFAVKWHQHARHLQRIAALPSVHVVAYEALVAERDEAVRLYDRCGLLPPDDFDERYDRRSISSWGRARVQLSSDEIEQVKAITAIGSPDLYSTELTMVPSDAAIASFANDRNWVDHHSV